MRGIKALLARKMQILLLHVLDKEELDPTLSGDLKLIDSETNEYREVSISPHILAQYIEQVKSFTEGLRSTASRYGMDYVQTSTAVPFETVIMQSMRRIGLIK